jgi:hypothetical protein
VKPNLSAPGVNVMSSVPGGGYEYWDGTSMATPHAAGTAALMLSANPALTPDAVLSTLGETAFWDARYGDERPNIRFGMGRINAYDAVARIAYNSGITGVVTDRGSGAPLDQAEVAVEGSNRSTHTKADGSFSLLLPPGTYTLKVSRFGYGAATISNVAVTDGKLTKADAGLAALPAGTVSGQVKYDRTGIGIPGATVRVKGIPIKIAAETDAEGSYSLKLPVGAYDLDFSAFGFGTVQVGGVAVSDTAPAVQDATLQSLPRVFVIGDFDDQLAGFLRASGYLADAGGMEVVQHLADYSAVIFNMAPKLTEKEFRELVDSAERNGVGLLFTKGYWYGWGIDLLRDYYGDPAVSESNWYPVELNGRVDAEHPDLLPGRAVGDLIPILPAGYDMGYFSGYSGQTVLSLTNSMADNIGGGVAYRQNAGNRHVLLASFGVLPWQGPAQWTPEAQEIFRNAVRWAAKPETGGPRYVLWNLKATPDTVLWSEPVTVSVGVKNIGDGAGTTDLAISVNDMPEPAQSFTLYPGRYAVARFAVQREPVGAYKVKAGPLAATFRVRPPKVSVSAQTIYLPPSGKGRNADPGEPAIPLAGAQVDVVKGGQVISRGKLDQNGALTFDSTASKADYTLVVRHTGYGYNTRRSYLLTLPVHVEADSTYAFAPQASGAAQLDVALTAKDPSHHGSLFVAGGALGQAAYEFPAGAPLVATPGSYQLATVMAWDVPGAQWAYVSDWSAMNLVAGRQAYTFGGDLRLAMADVRGQQAPKPSVTWGMSDAYSHSLSAIYRVTAGAFGPAHNRVLTDRATWPATVAATAQDVVRPVLTLTNPAGAIEQTGPINWAERPRAIAFDTATVATGDYSLLLQSDTGPYMGQLQAAAKLMLPARAVSRTLLMPGDTFDVTVVFDAGSAGDLTLTETLPAGFAIVRQSSNPNSDFRGATWTWHASGRGAYRPGQTIRVTYTVQVGRDVPAGTYSLTGAVAQGGGSRLVAGPQAVQVVR